MSIVAERHLDLASVQSAWQGLNKLVPLGPITSEKDYKRRVSVMDELLDRIGANESHRLMPLLDLVTKEVEAYEAKQQTLPEATPAKVLAFLMEERQLKQRLSQRLAVHLRRHAAQVGELAFPLPVAANHMVAGLLGLIEWWLAQARPLPIAAMAGLYERLIIQATWRALDARHDLTLPWQT